MFRSFRDGAVGLETLKQFEHIADVNVHDLHIYAGTYSSMF